jgi:putative two-component system response regulator
MPSSRRRFRILLVDDEPSLRELLRVTFEEARVAVEEAGSGEEAEAAIRSRRPDVVVLDLRMPGMDGAALCRRLKADAATAGIPVVLLTGAEGDDLRRARSCGADELVRKPFSPLELLALVERLGGRGRRTPTRPRAPVREAADEEELLLYARDLRHVLELERGQRRALADAYVATISALANALETRDAHTRAHSRRVQAYASALLRALEPTRLDEEPRLQYGFLLHDVGKIGIPDRILLKPGPLTRAERRQMETHTLLGEQMLSGVRFLEGEPLRIVREHHERWDGRGYPDRKGGEEISLGARVFAVADALDAMTSHRPYRRALPWAVARAEIVAGAGAQFDPAVVEAFREHERTLKEARRGLHEAQRSRRAEAAPRRTIPAWTSS